MTETKRTIYTYKSKDYVIFEETKMKFIGAWVDCVIYETLYDNPDGKYWVRTREEFYNKFKIKV